jgi:hypothetical protein
MAVKQRSDQVVKHLGHDAGEGVGRGEACAVGYDVDVPIYIYIYIIHDKICLTLIVPICV